MAMSASARTRAPRGTKQVITAFFVALGEVPEAQRGSVGKAALVGIRDEMKAQRDKAKVAAARAKTKAAATKTMSPKTMATRGRLPADASDTAVTKRKARVTNATA